MSSPRYLTALIVVLVVAGTCVPTVGAQQRSSGDAVRVTVIGCVMRADAVARPESDQSGERKEEPGYLLTNITLAEDPDHPSENTSPFDIAQGVKSYRLENDARIGRHLGDRVEISGVLVPDNTPAPAARGERGRQVVTPKLRVESLRLISSKSTVCLQ
jgi:hypothetical protein